MLISLVRIVPQRKVVVRRHWRIFLPPPKGGESRLFFFAVSRLMPRYYFDLRRDSLTDQDQHGQHLPDITAARAEAIVAAVEFVAEANPAEIPDFQIAVRDGSGTVLFEVNALEWAHASLRLPQLN
jgi:hypothetical protein